MCLFTHFAAGALAGGATGHVGWAIPAGAASHALLDAIPHYDHPDWRVELAGGLGALVLLLLMPFATPAAIVGGLFGMAPDLENLMQKLGRLDRRRFVFPSHTGLIPHGRTLGPRSLVWQAAIFAGCFVALGLVAPGEASAALDEDAGAIMAAPVVQILSGDRDHTLLRIDFPVRRQPALWDGLSQRQIRWALPERIMGDREGSDALLPPALTLHLAVPMSGRPRTVVQSVAWWRDPDRPVPDEELAAFAAPRIYRSVPLSGSDIPLGIEGGVLRSLTVRVDHPTGATWRADEALARTVEKARSGPGTAAPPYQVVNPDVYAELTAIARGAALARHARKAESAELFGLTTHWARFRIDETGVYRITGQELLLAGVTNTSVHPGSLRLYRGGGLPLADDPALPDSLQADRVGLNEIPIEVLGAGDGEWNLDDELRFYGVATSAWLDRLQDGADPLEHYDHIQAAEAVYWLTWEAGATSPLPGAPRRIASTSAAPTGGEALEIARLRLHFEQQNYEDAGRVADNFVWYNALNASAVESFLLPGAVADSTAFFVLDWRGLTDDRSRYYHTIDAAAWANNSLATRVSDSFRVQDQQDSLRVRLSGPFPPVVGAANTIHLQNASTWAGHRDIAWDSFDILYWAELDLTDRSGQLEIPVWDVQTDAAQADLVVAAGGQAALLWDVTDPMSPRPLTGASTAAHPDATTFGVDLPAGENRHFQALTESRLLDVGNIELPGPVVLREQTADVDYVVIYPGAFRTAARALADFRSTNLPGVEAPEAIAVEVQDIYDNFSGGQKDWRAIRNYLRHVYETGGGRLQYVCLLGNACRDYRNYFGRTAQVDQFYDFVPTDLRTVYPRSPSWYLSEAPYASDDGLVSFDTPGSSGLDFPDVAVGRLPAISAAEAEEMVQRTVSYLTDTREGPWRNRFLLVADDQHKQNEDPGQSEHWHTFEAELIAEGMVPPTLDVRKIYALEYEFPPGSITKPAVKADINTVLNNGTTVYHYIGHGSQDSLADERIFDVDDIAALNNGLAACVFIAFSCDVGVYDSTNRRSMGELFLTADQGGAVATITASQVSFITYNNQLTNAFYPALFPDRTVDPAIGLGQALQWAKANMVLSGSQRNSQRYNVMGDPALVLPHPVNDLAFAADTADSLLTGRLHTARLDAGASAEAPAAGDHYQLRVEEASTGHSYISYEGDVYYYVQRGAPVFRGSGTVEDPDAEVSFMVPTQIRFGEDARVRMIVGDGDGEHAVQMRLPAARAVGQAGTDLAGPEIELAFAEGLQNVRPAATLNATLSDPSGIAAVGTSPITSILLEFDDTGFMSDLTESFAYDPDSYTTGRISLALPSDMEEGDHSVSLYAADAFGNVGSDTLSFRIQDSISTGVESVALFPNPTSGPCRLVFELGEPMQLQWDIFTLSGHRLRTIQAGFDAAGPASIGWDGRDDQGDEIANGTYLYVLRGRGERDPDHPFHKTGKLVLMK